jgi:hypothetical protein
VQLPDPPRNIVLEAIGYYEYLKADAGRSYAHVSEHFGVSRARISQFVGIITRLPEGFIVSMKECSDPALLKTFTGKELIRISRLPNLNDRRKAISHLQLNVNTLKLPA